MPAFEKELMDSETGKKVIARVSNFIVKNGKIEAITNSKATCSKESAEEAKQELENFIKFIKALQSTEKFKELSLDFSGQQIQVKDIDTSKIKKMTIGPKGGKKLGFNEEIDYTEKELKELTKTIKSI